MNVDGTLGFSTKESVINAIINLLRKTGDPKVKYPYIDRIFELREEGLIENFIGVKIERNEEVIKFS